MERSYYILLKRRLMAMELGGSYKNPTAELNKGV